MKLKIRNTFLASLLILPIAINSVNAQKVNKKERTVMFYNVENLYDTINDPAIDDEEFLPDAKKKWNTERYNKKLTDLAKVIESVAPGILPDFVGFAEIENRAVVEALLNTDLLKAGKYKVVHENSPDGRGIDVAFAYKSGSFSYLGHEKISVTLPNDTNFITRDILHVWGTAGKKDTMHFFVNHWPSRRAGSDESEPKRMAAADKLQKATEKIFKTSPDAKIIIMGDMNDEPKNKSLTETLGAANPETGAKSALYNLLYPDDELNNGTYLFQGSWNMLDNMVVSNGLLNAKKGFKSAAKGIIHQAEFMMFTNKKGEKSPNRTYGGDNYFGGISDHLPIYLKLTK